MGLPFLYNSTIFFKKRKMMELKNKVAVVTGASGGIGKAIARNLSEKGCKVVLASRSTDTLKEIEQSLSSEGFVVAMDVSNTKSVADAFEKIHKKYEQVDILVNCAGVMPLSYMKNRHIDEWLETMNVNVNGALRCIYEVLPDMKKRKSGHIVNITSVDGKELYEGGAVYGASKAALIALSRALRMELSPEFNIRVASIEPGTVDTDLREDITDKELLDDKDYGGDEAKLQPQHIADAVVYIVGQPQEVNINELLIKPTGKS